jgi:hypothetical protein
MYSEEKRLEETLLSLLSTKKIESALYFSLMSTPVILRWDPMTRISGTGGS